MKVPKFKLKLRVTVPPNRVHIPKVVYDRRSEKDQIENELREQEEVVREEQGYLTPFFQDCWW